VVGGRPAARELCLNLSPNPNPNPNTNSAPHGQNPRPQTRMLG